MCRTVCIIDDDRDMREVLARIARSVGLPTEQYESAEAFLQRDDRTGIGCLLVDVELPRTSGSALLERLAIDGMDVPAFLLSGGHDAASAASALRTGAVLIHKPFDARLLAQKILAAVNAAEH